MIDGTYQVMMKTPMGVKKGELTLKSENNALTGSIYVMDRETPLLSGTTDGANFSFSGDLETAAGKLAYNCAGRVDGDVLSGMAKTRKGDFPLTGTRQTSQPPKI